MYFQDFLHGPLHWWTIVSISAMWSVSRMAGMTRLLTVYLALLKGYMKYTFSTSVPQGSNQKRFTVPTTTIFIVFSLQKVYSKQPLLLREISVLGVLRTYKRDKRINNKTVLKKLSQFDEELKSYFTTTNYWYEMVGQHVKCSQPHKRSEKMGVSIFNFGVSSC